MATISFQVNETGFANLTKTFTFQDAHLDRMIASYQAGANASVNGIATRAQVLNFWVSGVINEAVQNVQAFEARAAIPAAITPT